MDLEWEMGNFLGARRELVAAMEVAYRAGASASAVAVSVVGAFGRDQVVQYLAALTVADTARLVLAEAGLAGALTVGVRGIEAPRQVVLQLAADQSELDDRARIPARIREAFTGPQLTLGLVSGWEQEDPRVSPEDLLLDGHPVQVIAVQPRRATRGGSRMRRPPAAAGFGAVAGAPGTISWAAMTAAGIDTSLVERRRDYPAPIWQATSPDGDRRVIFGVDTDPGDVADAAEEHPGWAIGWYDLEPDDSRTEVEVFQYNDYRAPEDVDGVVAQVARLVRLAPAEPVRDLGERR